MFVAEGCCGGCVIVGRACGGVGSSRCPIGLAVAGLVIIVANIIAGGDCCGSSGMSESTLVASTSARLFLRSAKHQTVPRTCCQNGLQATNLRCVDIT
jgi:hypothetical protein